MARLLRITGKVVTTVAVLVAVLVVTAVLVVPRVTGGAALTVLSGSMTPTYPVGSIVVVVPTDPTTIQPGDVITYQAAPGVAEFVTHRVVRVQHDTQPLSFVTKGDANTGEDREPVPVGAVRGTVRFHLPHLGTVGDVVRTPPGMLALGGPLVLLFVATQVRTILRELRRPDADAAPAASNGPPTPIAAATPTDDVAEVESHV